jgi:hypothetical protein
MPQLDDMGYTCDGCGTYELGQPMCWDNRRTLCYWCATCEDTEEEEDSDADH